jgi:putative surface-exposed virulence protein
VEEVMGVNKKFLLLAFLIVTSVSYSYGDKVLTEDTKSSNSKKPALWAAGGTGTIEKNVTVTVETGGIGINVKYEEEKINNQPTGNKKEGTGINNGIIKVTGKNSKGIFINNTSNTKNKNSAKNENRIEVLNNGIGVYFNSGSDGNFYNNKEMIISDKDSKGIFINSKGNAENNGDIFVGYKVDENGQIVNGGAGAIGVQVNNSNAQFINNKDANIKVAEGSQGIQVNKGKAINQGIIEATAKNATGVYMHGETGNFENTNRIEVSGESSKGIFFGVDGGKVTNNGIINVTNQGTGVFSYKGKLDGDKPTPSKNQNNFTNGKDGTINVYGKKSVGFLLDTLNDKGKIVNEGTINIYDQGTGVKLGGTTFTNSGTIEVKNSGIAIESVKDTNNTVVLKNGSKIKGNIQGNTGVDVLAVEGGGEYKDLSITSYDKIVSLKNENSTDDAIISNSNISLEFNSGTKDYANDELNKEKAGLTIKDSNLVVDLTNKTEGSSLVDTGDGKLTLDGNMKIAFNGVNGEKEFNISEILGDEIVAGNANFESSAMWDYTTENGDLIAKKKSYTEAVGKSQLEDFGKALEQSENGKIEDGDFKTGLTLLGLLDASQFTDAMTQLSGGVHGYTVDFAAINSRTLSNAIKNRELNKERLRDKALNSYDQEVAYINNHHKLGGLMNVDYNEDGVLGITEKQIMPNGKLGLVYGGAKGKAKFENGKHGKADMDNLYLGGYYAYDFTDKLTLVSNANFVYSHTNVTRNIKFSKESKEGDVSKLEQTYDSTYPVFGFGGGATLYYTPYNSLNNSVTLYGGIDWTKIVQGNINEDSDNAENKTNVTIKNLPADEQMYDSVVPHIGLSLANNGYIFNRKYRLGVNVDYETELGNIKNGKKLKLSALSTPHRVETTERENIVSYSLNGALDLTEDFTIYGNYTKADSDEYDAERVEAGFKYKMDRMSDLFVTGPLLGNIENSKPYSRRWTGVASFILDGEDDSDRSYYTEQKEHSRGDYATSLKLKPKFTLSLNDRDTKWSYYFETYYMSNGMGMNLDKNERRKSESRIHAEARWTDQYSKGRYGFNIGYRNETTSSPTLSQYVQRDRLTRGLHQFRFTPNFTYNLGNGFIFGGSTTGIIAYDYEGYRKGQTDFELENEYGITYNGLMPRWRFNVNYFREETWYDNDFRKPSVKGEVEGDRRYQSNQLRPRITYFFGNGGRVELSARMPLGNGYWYTSDDHGKKAAEKYETRYGVKYYQPITPGLTGMIGGEILTIKTKNTNHSSNDYGKETRDYSIRPTIGISYNF